MNKVGRAVKGSALSNYYSFLSVPFFKGIPVSLLSRTSSHDGEVGA